ncbi:hypothetical protein BVX97_00085, partial [bacterium E08(2017)]
VVGGVEQGALRIADNMSKDGNECVVVCKASREAEVRDLLEDRPGLKIVTVDVESHAMCEENEALDSGFFQDLAEAEGAELIHYFYNWSFPQNKKVPCLLTVHDVIPFTFQEAMPDEIHKNIYKPGIKRACELNDMIATVSEFSRQDIAKTVGVPLEKIRVVYNGLREPAGHNQDIMNDLTKRFGLENGYILNAGGIHERKNIVRMVQAFAKLVNNGYAGKLLITGKASGAPYQEEQRAICDAAIAEAGMQDRVIFGGFVTEDELDNLLGSADIFIYPSLYEGFGIPILEAMKLKTPVVTSTVTAMPEVAGGAAMLADPESVESMTACMKSLLEDDALRAELIEKGLAQSAEFSWDRNGREYMAIYEEMTAG